MAVKGLLYQTKSFGFFMITLATVLRCLQMITLKIRFFSQLFPLIVDLTSVFPAFQAKNLAL